MGFEVLTEPTAPMQARKLRAARSRSGINVATAARRMDITIFQYLLLEQGNATLAEGEWTRAIDLISLKP